MTLAELQKAFQSYYLERDPAVAPAISARGQRGLPVYSHAYRATLKAALANTYAKTLAWLGDDIFDMNATAFVEATPSRSWTLDDYGATFPAFLSSAHPGDPDVAELAWLECALHIAFSVETHSPIDPASLAATDWSRARLVFAPGVAARTVITDVPAIWHALSEDRAPAAFALDGPMGLVVWRAGLSPRFRSADPQETQLILASHKGIAFGAACGALENATPDQVGAWLARWIGDRLLVALVED